MAKPLLEEHGKQRQQEIKGTPLAALCSCQGPKPFGVSPTGRGQNCGHDRASSCFSGDPWCRVSPFHGPVTGAWDLAPVVLHHGGGRFTSAIVLAMWCCGSNGSCRDFCLYKIVFDRQI